MSQSANLIVFPLKPSMLSYFLIRKHVCVKSSVVGGGGLLANIQPLSHAKLVDACPMSGTHKAGKCPTVEPGGMGIAGIDGA